MKNILKRASDMKKIKRGETQIYNQINSLKIRKTLGITQTQLSEKTSISLSTIQTWDSLSAKRELIGINSENYEKLRKFLSKIRRLDLLR